jgi:hypothetical protein
LNREGIECLSRTRKNRGAKLSVVSSHPKDCWSVSLSHPCCEKGNRSRLRTTIRLRGLMQTPKSSAIGNYSLQHGNLLFSVVMLSFFPHSSLRYLNGGTLSPFPTEAAQYSWGCHASRRDLSGTQDAGGTCADVKDSMPCKEREVIKKAISDTNCVLPCLDGIGFRTKCFPFCTKEYSQFVV